MSEQNHTAPVVSAPPSSIENLTGHKFGRLLVVGYAAIQNRSHKMWICRCECGVVKPVMGQSLRNGASVSCGCLKREKFVARNTTHGMGRHGKNQSPEYRCWVHIRDRCFNHKDRKYNLYGGRGITVCQEWRDSFEAFYAYVGPRPSPEHSIDRFPNRDGNYEPGNVRWATITEQNENTSRNRFVTISGRTQCFKAWCRENGISYDLARDRIRNGWTDEEAVTTKSRGSGKRRLKQNT